MSSIENDKAFAIEALVDTFKVLNKQLDYSIGSLQHIEALFNVEINPRTPVIGDVFICRDQPRFAL